MRHSLKHDNEEPRTTRRPVFTGRPATAAMVLLMLLGGCAAQRDGATGTEGPSQLVVHTSVGSGPRVQSPRGTQTAPVPPAPPARSESLPPRRAEPGTAAAATERRSHGPTTMLNFVDADLQGVVRALAAFTGRNFVVDPRVRGPLTLVSEVPVDADTAYSMLLAALRMQGYAVVDVGGVSRVVPEADAKLQGGPVSAGEAAAGGGEIVTRVFQLHYENATSLVPVLRPMIAPNNTINAYAANNTLVISDYADNLDRIARVIEEIDRPDAFSTDVIPIRYGVALDVAALAAQLLDNRGRNDPAGNVVVVADPRSNSVLLRAGNPERLALARDLIHRIDRPDSGTGNLHVVHLRNAQATQLAEVLRGALGGSSGSGMNPGTPAAALMQAGMDAGLSTQPAGAGMANPTGFGATPATMGMGATTAPGGSEPFSLVSRPVSFTAGGATIQADPATNTLIISAPPPLYRSLREIIDRLDQRRAQVLVESLIVEVKADDAAEFGIQWMVGGSDIASGRSAFFGGANLGGTGVNAQGITSIDALGQGMSLGVVKGTVNILGNELLNLNVLARALESRGTANVLSTPNLMTLDNEEASITVGQTVPFVTGSYTTSADGASNPFQTISREDVGLTLRIRPQISEGNTVKLSLYQEVSSVDEAATLRRNGLVTRKRALETDVLVDDGQIIVLGGLLEDSISDGRKAVPVLGDLPVLGNLFRYDTRSRSKTNLMIFLRPHIVRDARDSAGVTLDRYNYMRAAQAQLPPIDSWIGRGGGITTLPAFDRNPETGLLDLREPQASP